MSAAQPIGLCVLAVDIGGTGASAELFAVGEPRARAYVTWPDSASGGDAPPFAAVLGAVRATVARWGVPSRVGVSVAPTLDIDGTITRWPNRPEWVGVPLVPLLCDAAGGAPVTSGDDGDLAALAEDAAIGSGHTLYLGLGTGVAAGIVAGGVLQRAAGELGHLVIDPSGPRCACGARGCVQAYAGGRALSAAATLRRQRPATTYDLVAAVGAGETWATDLRDEAGRALVQAAAHACSRWPIADVVVGGGLGAVLPGILAAMRDELPRALRSIGSSPTSAPEIRSAAYGAYSSLAGARLIALDAGLGDRG